jgi:enamine deaminase RidA (YjgF/YER057c/UK114 family)
MNSLRLATIAAMVCATIVVAVGQKSSKAANTATTQKPAIRIYNPDTIHKPAAGYSHVAEIDDGKLIYISGQVAIDRAGNPVGKDDFRAQATQVFENLKAAAESAGGNFQSIVKINYYVAESVDPSQFQALRDVRDKYVNTATPPTSTFVVVKRLARPEWMLEVEAVAVVKR